MDQTIITKQSEALEALENLRKRLLDPTARNRLINYNHPKRQCLRIIDELPNHLVELLLKEEEICFKAIPEPTKEELTTAGTAGYLEFDEKTQQPIPLRDHPSATEWAKYLGFKTSYEVPTPTLTDAEGMDEHSDKAIQTLLYPYELETRLKSLLQTAESAVQDMGVNILYLAFGFLEWFDSRSSDSPRSAPLFLVPVRLSKGRLNSTTRTYEYSLTYSGEDIIPNLSLREKLKIDFSMALPDLDECTIPEDYLEQTQALIKNKEGPSWQVHRYISLALLNFSKLLMYLDLDNNQWPEGSKIVDHPVVSSVLSGSAQGEDQDAEVSEDFRFGEEYCIDEIEGVHAKYPLIDDADSSQHNALMDAVNGKNLVIVGPPGTGKSQTITNLIAATMAQGKKVLFVAEKLVALEVVRSHLDKVGLGDFCLELHSHKSQRRKILGEINKRLTQRRRFRQPRDIEIEIARYEEHKTELKEYAENINRPWKNTGKTLHQIFMAATRHGHLIASKMEALQLEGERYRGNNYNALIQRQDEDKIQIYVKTHQALRQQLGHSFDLKKHPWYGVRNAGLQKIELDSIKRSLGGWQESIQRLQKHRRSIADTLGCSESETGETVIALQELLTELESIPALKGNELLDHLPSLRGEMLQKVQDYLERFEEIQNLYTQLAETTALEVLNDLSVVDQFLAANETLKKLIGRNVVLGEQAEAINRLTAIGDQLSDLQEPLGDIASALGESATHLQVSESGLREYKDIIDLVARLKSSHWKYRDELFDNEELDEILPRLHTEIEETQTVQGRIQGVFSLDRRPTESEIRQLIVTLSQGGAFRWLKASWRMARKRLLSYSANPKVKFSTMLSLMDDLATFFGRKTALEQDSTYKQILGEHFCGLDTKYLVLQDLRNGYKLVREQYGVGFGHKVRLGDAILALSPSAGRAIRSLVEHDLQTQLADLIDGLNSLKEVFSPLAEMQDPNTLLIGEQGLIPRLLTEVNEAIRACGLLTNDDSRSLGELADQIEQLSTLKMRVGNWQNADLDHTLFQGKLGLELGARSDNSAGLSILGNTLKLAASIDKKIDNPALVKYIYENATEESFTLLRNHSQQLCAIVESQQRTNAEYTDLVDLDPESWLFGTSGLVDKLIPRNDLALDNGEKLHHWLHLVDLRDQLDSIGMRRLTDAVENSVIEITQLKKAYQAAIYGLLAREILHEEPKLSRFSGLSHEASQEQFRECDNRLKKLQSEQIAWKINQIDIPAGQRGGRVTQYSERALLEHECNKQNKHIPIRQLLRRAGHALVAIKPCFMMSPMSVAQYLGPGAINFDLVVMDEASQIKPQDALGAVARGDQLVVVGDPKQLPPTSFFERIFDDDGDEDGPMSIEESESILDATRPMFPARRLRWHYRSQHESLIAFSNHSFYDSELVLFSSPYKETEHYGIQYFRLEQGCFVNRKNIEEAEVISEAVREHFRRQVGKPEEEIETLGVVAMNSDQRNQIEANVEALAKDDVAFQEWLDKDKDKDKDARRNPSLFIKSLENVQGDERDVILISMTYGPGEPKGRVYQRFGPINSDLGWRRLNVLFTRSKKRMHIFSSMDSDDIIIGPDSTRGVRALRDFLSYCKTGILHNTESETGREPDSDFEIAVTAALRDEGFECIPQVGVDGFFIDVAVVDPGNSGRYLMGIECDGARYHSAKSVRDRDRLRQSILERLGWRMRRIWSTDWFRDPRGALAPIITELHELKSPIKVELESEFEADEIQEVIEIIEPEADQPEELPFELPGSRYGETTA